ncbi:hypothetical protein ABZW10_29100 [Kitasatospora sp. NPDC004723]|uniref:hypothetical protein n=1 Tax=Kitasatospora sp. NPDC004723 TaxID=3154288 RepID=UPI0033A29911
MGMLTEDCMHRAGYKNWRPAPPLPRMGPKTRTDLRYGIHDATLVGKRGYHPDAAEQAAHEAAVAAGAVGPSGAEAAAENNCGQQGKQKLGDVQEAFQFAEQLANEAYVKAQQEPEVAAAFAQWSACMKESGYVYREPLDVASDRKFGGEVTKAEIETAQTDLQCRGRTNLALTWFEAESKLQKASEEKNALVLQDGRKKLDATMKTVTAVLAGRS